MVDEKNRLVTYRNWPLLMLNPKQLAKCGFYYTGVLDVVTCYCCNGSLGGLFRKDMASEAMSSSGLSETAISLVKRVLHGLIDLVLIHVVLVLMIQELIQDNFVQDISDQGVRIIVQVLTDLQEKLK
ncbi:hypothetical protein TNCV_3051171 [Trichonephila clavipes]|nr:hypothetical protein TNCV_3051171 [Trichonephila clavipes]